MLLQAFILLPPPPGPSRARSRRLNTLVDGDKLLALSRTAFAPDDELSEENKMSNYYHAGAKEEEEEEEEEEKEEEEEDADVEEEDEDEVVVVG